MTKAIYAATAEYEAEIKQLPVKRRVSVSGILYRLGVSRSGCHAWKKRIPSDTQKRREKIMRKTREIYGESHQNYGAPKITKELEKAGIHVSEKTIGNYMRDMGIKAQWVKPFTHTTTDSDFSSRLQNILDEKFNPETPNAVWVSDITYIWSFEGFVYLTSIMDLFSRKIISWVLSDTLEAFRNATARMINSYSKKAYPWDNACIESFHALIKRKWLNRFKIFNRNHAYKLVFEYIETFYNTVRSHSHCGYLSPNQYEAEYLSKMEESAMALAG